jgi:hypothetical protein
MNEWKRELLEAGGPLDVPCRMDPSVDAVVEKGKPCPTAKRRTANYFR